MLAKCLNKDPLKRATVDELLNDPFINDVYGHVAVKEWDKSYEKNCQIVKWIRELCTKTNIFTCATIKSSVCMIMTANVLDRIARMKDYYRHVYQFMNENSRGPIKRESLFNLFIGVGYRYSLFEPWCDDLLAAYGHPMILKDCQRDCSKRCKEHKYETEGISINGFNQIVNGYSLLESEEYRDRAFDVLDQNRDGNIDFDELMTVFGNGNVLFEYDMDEIKKSRATSTSRIEIKVRRMIQEIDQTGDGMISKAEFNNAITT